MAKKPKAKTNKPMKYTATDGTLFLELKAGESGYTVTSPFIPGMVTEAETLEEAFTMARNAVVALKASGRKLAKEPSRRTATKPAKQKATRRA